MKGQVTVPTILYTILLLIVFSSLLPVINESITIGLSNMDPASALLARLSPFIILLSILMIPSNQNRILNFVFGDKQRGFR
ncbi:MAG: hypothetical protein ACTSW1_07335 [Candidatus Hodarchaeales archaeon]